MKENVVAPPLPPTQQEMTYSNKNQEDGSRDTDAITYASLLSLLSILLLFAKTLRTMISLSMRDLNAY